MQVLKERQAQGLVSCCLQLNTLQLRAQVSVGALQALKAAPSLRHVRFSRFCEFGEDEVPSSLGLGAVTFWSQDWGSIMTAGEFGCFPCAFSVWMVTRPQTAVGLGDGMMGEQGLSG